MLANMPRLMTAYYTRRPDPSVREQRVAFGTSGHRGSSLDGAFNEAHILAITQAICDVPAAAGDRRPALPRHRHARALGAGLRQRARGAGRQRRRRDDRRPRRLHADAGRLARHPHLQPRPRERPRRRHRRHAVAQSAGGRRLQVQPAATADPPTPTSPAGSRIGPTRCSPTVSRGVKRIPFERARRASTTHRHDYIERLRRRPRAASSTWTPSAARDQPRRRSARRRRRALLGAIAERYGLPLTVVNDAVDPTFRFMTVDWDGKIRMDCSSPYAMQRLIALKDRFDVAWACDTDHDRHGIVARSAGLLNPNHYLAVAISYLFAHRPGWPTDGGDRQDGGEQQHDRPRGRPARAPAGRGAGRLQVVRRRPPRRRRSASAARRAPAPRSCAATARCGPPTRTGSSSVCSPPRSRR